METESYTKAEWFAKGYRWISVRDRTRCPDSEAPAVSTRQCHPALVLPEARLKSSSPHDSRQFPVSECLSRILQNTKKNYGFQEPVIPTEDNPKERWSEAHTGKHTPTCGIQRLYEQTPPRHVSHLLYHPSLHRTFLRRARALAHTQTGVSVSSGPSNAG